VRASNPFESSSSGSGGFLGTSSVTSSALTGGTIAKPIGYFELPVKTLAEMLEGRDPLMSVSKDSIVRKLLFKFVNP
jgi:hypothetical protein